MNTFYDLTAKTIDQKDFYFHELKGKTILIVNVASECGLTSQYEALEKIYEKYSKQNFVVIGFPANNFGAQEPGSNEQIALFCKSHFGVKFQMMAKISVKGTDIHPVYKFLTESAPTALTVNGDTFEKDIADYGFPRSNPKDVLWNFEKFLISKNGTIAYRFNPDIKPDHEIVIKAIQEIL